MRIPIFASLLFANIGLVTITVGILIALSVREFRADKETYVLDFASQVAEGAAEQIDAGVDAQREKLALMATVVLDGSRTASDRSKLVEALFVHYPEVARLEIVHEGKPGQPPVRLHNLALLRKVGFGSAQAYEGWRAKQPETVVSEADLAMAARQFQDGTTGVTLAFRHAASGATVRGDLVARGITEPFAEPGVAELFLVDAKGTVVLFHDLDAVREGIELSGSALFTSARKNKLPGSMNFEENGRAYLGASAPVASGDLVVLSRVPEDRAYAAGNRLVRKSLFAGLGLLALMSLASVIVARRFSAPLVRMLRATERIASGDFKVAVAVDRRNEIGDLAQSINHMTAELHARDERLRQQQEALVASEKMAALGTLGAGIAHEVKNPLTGILGFAELAMRKVKPEDPVVRYLQMIDRETRRCTEIIGNLLSFSRREKVEFKPTDLNQVIADTYKLVNHQLSLKKVQIDIQLSPDLPLVNGHANQLQQVMLNFSINAGDAMPNGGKLVLATGQRKGPSGPEVFMTATDTGTGMPPEVKAKIFDPFFTTKEPGKGTGLGLSVTFGIVKDHGGTLSVDSVVGKGTTFTVTIPALAAAAAEPRPVAAAAGAKA